MSDLSSQLIFLARAMVHYDVPKVSEPVHAWDIAKQMNIVKPGYISAMPLNEVLNMNKIRSALKGKGFQFENMFQKVETSSGCTETIRGWKISFPPLSANFFHTEWVSVGKTYDCSKLIVFFF
jgi:hypothetical protein